MEIVSKYNGRCKACGGQIVKGEKIKWFKSSGAVHADCGAPVMVMFGGSLHISHGQGHGGAEYRVGQKIRHKEYGVFVVRSTSRQYFRENGIKHGVGKESGYLFLAYCDREEKIVAINKIPEIEKIIKTEGEHLIIKERPAGDRIGIRYKACFVLGVSWIWLVKEIDEGFECWRVPATEVLSKEIRKTTELAKQ